MGSDSLLKGQRRSWLSSVESKRLDALLPHGPLGGGVLECVSVTLGEKRPSLTGHLLSRTWVTLGQTEPWLLLQRFLLSSTSRWLCNTAIDTRTRRWAVEGLAYLTLDADVKDDFVQDIPALQAMFELAKARIVLISDLRKGCLALVLRAQLAVGSSWLHPPW